MCFNESRWSLVGRWGRPVLVDTTLKPPRQKTGDNSILLIPIRAAQMAKPTLNTEKALAPDVQPRLDTLDAQFLAAIDRALEQSVAPKERALWIGYIETLNRLIQEKARSLALEEALALKNQKAIVEANQSLPALLEKSPAFLSAADHEKELKALQTLKRQVLAPVNDTYEQALSRYVVRLTDANRLEDALTLSRDKAP